jgi:GNAT superfamily N-acetyltransferase
MAKVHIVSWRETYPGMLPDRMLARLSIADEAIRWQRTLDRAPVSGSTLAFVADQQGSILGYGTCHEQRTGLLYDQGFTGEVSELYVLSEAQGHGLGSRLMSAMASALLDHGHHAMSVWVLERNIRARGFYESRGGKLIARKRNNLFEIAYGWSDLQRLVVQSP